MGKLSFAVKGMHCAGCAASVERLREARRRIDILLCGTDNEIPELEETLSFEKGPYLYPGFIRLSHSALV